MTGSLGPSLTEQLRTATSNKLNSVCPNLFPNSDPLCEKEGGNIVST